MVEVGLARVGVVGSGLVVTAEVVRCLERLGLRVSSVEGGWRVQVVLWLIVVRYWRRCLISVRRISVYVVAWLRAVRF